MKIVAKSTTNRPLWHVLFSETIRQWQHEKWYKNIDAVKWRTLQIWFGAQKIISQETQT